VGAMVIALALAFGGGGLVAGIGWATWGHWAP
jgi:hypothetical protein